MSSDSKLNEVVGAGLAREPGVAVGPIGFVLPWLNLEAS